MADTLILGTTIIEDKRSEKGEIWSCKGVGFLTDSPDIDNITFNADGITALSANAAVTYFREVELPNGVTVTKVIVYGSDTADTWELKRAPIASAASAEVLASGVIDTEDTSISFPIINNDTYGYFFRVAGLSATSDQIRGARIIYEF